ncbi:MAG TPA: response regulator transcription factor [Candidatus Megaira endosymbiont of Hartmannula sinica]|nr:response regulator transcription factor [Candidatus Megaera endosymbiont of Hartmannula sinica]
MRVLLIEDDSVTARTIQVSLAAEGIICEIAEIGEEGVELSRLYDYDVIILDLKLPDVDGWEVLSRLRSARIKTPVLILSGYASIDDKVRGLSIGADDYLTKPFDKAELVARVNAIYRRSLGHAESIVRFGRISVNLDAREVLIDDKKVRLTPKEYSIIELLAIRKGTVVSKQMFFNHIYSGMDEPEMKIIDVFIFKLRKKLADASGGLNYINTSWGHGYTLEDPELSRQSETNMVSHSLSKEEERELIDNNINIDFDNDEYSINQDNNSDNREKELVGGVTSSSFRNNNSNSY